MTLPPSLLFHTLDNGPDRVVPFSHAVKLVATGTVAPRRHRRLDLLGHRRGRPRAPRDGVHRIPPELPR
jgi:hypothetical protein